MSYSSSKTISGCELMAKKIVTLDLYLEENKFVLIKGIVLNPMKIPIENAAVEVTIINNNYVEPKIVKKFTTFSESNGMYGISVPYDKCYSYILKAYST